MRRLAIAAVLGLCGLAASQSTRNVPYRDSHYNFVGADIPTALERPTISYSEGVAGWKVCTITFDSAIDFSGSNTVVELYFDSVSGGSLYDHGIILPLGNYTYKSTPAIQPGQAKIVEMGSYLVEGSASAVVTSNSITITYPTSIVGTDLTHIQLRYMPSSVSLSNVWQELNGAPKQTYLVHPSVIGTTSFFPKLPFASSPVPAVARLMALVGAGAVPFTQNPPGSPSDPTPPVIVEDDQDRPVSLPPSFGIGNPTGDPVQWQPLDPENLPPGVIAVDLDGDGENDDFILPGHDDLPGTGGTMIGYYTVDNVAIVVVVGKDDNGNGRIDPDEIDHVIAECKYDQAINSTGMIIKGGHPIVGWVNNKIEPDGQGGYRGTPAGKSEYIYEFDTVTGIIKVWIYDDDGNLMTFDEDGNLIIMNPQPPSGTFPPSWQGIPKDFPGWGSGNQGYPPPPALVA